MNERGSVSVIVAAIVPGLVIAGTVIVALTQVVIGSERAAAAAEAGALAAAPVTFRPFGTDATASQEAARVVAANGGALTNCSCPHDATWETRVVRVEVQVEVDVILFGSITLTRHARAEFSPTKLLPI